LLTNERKPEVKNYERSVCIVLLHLISMYMFTTFHPMFHCICMYVMSDLRLSDLNKETTYLLTYLICCIVGSTVAWDETRSKQFRSLI